MKKAAFLIIIIMIFTLSGCSDKTKKDNISSSGNNKNSSGFVQSANSSSQIRQLYINSDQAKQAIGRAYQLSTLFNGFYLPCETADEESRGSATLNEYKVLMSAMFTSMKQINSALSEVYTEEQVNNLIKTGVYWDSMGQLYCNTFGGYGNGQATIKSLSINLKTKNILDGSSVYSANIILANEMSGVTTYVISKQDIKLNNINGVYKVATPLIVQYHSLISENILLALGKAYETNISDYINKDKVSEISRFIVANKDGSKELSNYVNQIKNNKQLYNLLSTTVTASNFDENCIYKVTTDCEIQLMNTTENVETKHIKKVYSIQSDTKQFNLVGFKIVK